MATVEERLARIERLLHELVTGVRRKENKAEREEVPPRRDTEEER